MKELSLNILDITENSVKAGATLTEIIIDETDEKLTVKIKDDGCGMDEETVKRVINPFYTTRTTRKVGLGIPFYKLVAEQTGGSLLIDSKCQKEFPENHGTMLTAVFYKNHIDFTPLGDIVATLTTLIQGHPDTDFLFRHTKGENFVELDTRLLRETLGDEVPLSTYEVIKWIEEFLKEQYINL